MTIASLSHIATIFLCNTMMCTQHHRVRQSQSRLVNIHFQIYKSGKILKGVKENLQTFISELYTVAFVHIGLYLPLASPISKVKKTVGVM